MLSTLLKVLIPQFFAGAVEILKDKQARKENMGSVSTLASSLPAAIAAGSVALEGPLPPDNLETLVTQVVMSILALVLFFLRKPKA